MRTISRALPLFSLLFVLSFASFAQKSTSPITARTKKAIEAYLKKLEKIGYSGVVMVASDGKPVITKGYGYSDEERKVKNSSRTVLDIGSITKQFTAAAILKLEMQGKLSTDDKIVKYFHNVPSDKTGITIHQLLRHSSGLRSGIGGDYEEISEANFVQNVFASELGFPSGTDFSYSNIGYSLLALIIEKVSGQPYESYLYENLFKPAGMEMTGYSRPNFGNDLIAIGYAGDERWGRPIDRKWAGDAPYLHLKGNGGILSTTEDLLKWDRALATDAVLSKEAKQKYYFPALRENEAGRRSHYAYGWDVFKTERGTTRVWHNGTNRVFFADFYRFIDEGVTIILMTNRAQHSFNETGRVISRMIFEQNYTPQLPIPDNNANRAFTNEVIQLTLNDGLAVATKRFQKRKKGLDLLENVINAKGYDLLGEKKLKEAIEIFKLNAVVFPLSANAFDSLGEGYLESNNKPAAIENYRKSLSLDPENGNARDVLKRLEGN